MKKIYLIFGTACAVQMAVAQPVLNATDINPTIGETMIMINGGYVSEGSSGPNATWDLSTITGTSYTIQTGASSGSTPNANIDYDFVGQSHMYQQNTATEQNIYYQYASSVMITFSDPIKYLSFPLSMSTSYTDNFAATFVSSGYSFSRVGTVQCAADGYGTLTTPAGTFTDVLRVVITQNYTDTYSGGTLDYETTTYAWFKAGYHYAIASCVEVTTFQGTQQYSEYMQSASLEVSNITTEMAMVYPNPVESKLFIDFKDFDVENYELYNSTGNVIRTSEGNLNSFQTVDMNDLQSGIYFLRFTEGESRAPIKIVKQ